MRNSEVRTHVLRDHEALRRRLVGLERQSRRVTDDNLGNVGPLRQEALQLLSRLREHMRWEDRYLVPALREADAWGPERAKRFDDDHREQRETLALIVEELQEQRKPPSVLAKHLLDLVTDLLRDMEEEEAFFLDPRVLRDDVVGIDVETG